MRCQRPVTVFLVVPIFLAPGCTNRPPSYAAVGGTVSVDGKPAEGVKVTFWPANDADKDTRDRYATGFTGRDGRFEMRSMADSGIPDGEYKVTFSRTSSDGRVVTDQKKKSARSRELLPPKYTELDKTDVTARVTKDQRDFTFELMSSSK